MPQDHEFTGTIATTSGRLSIYAVGMSAGIFLAISFVLCVGFGLIFPTMTMYQACAYGWFIAILFVPLFNYFAERAAK